MLLGLMRQFPAYTLSALRGESAELLRLLKIEALARRDGEAPGG